MMLFDEAVKQRLLGGSSHLLQRDRTNAGERAPDRRCVHRNGLRFLSPEKRVERDLANRGQSDLARTVQHQQKTTADHIAPCAVGLLPVPRFAEFCGKLSSTQRSIRCDDLPYENDVFGCDCLASISPLNWHLPTVCRNKNRNVSTEAIFLYALTRRHTGAASVSGL